MRATARALQGARRLVVKIGSNILIDGQRLNLPFLAQLAEDVQDLRRSGVQVVLVSSGSVAAAMLKFGQTQRPRDLPGRQAYAAVGQMSLMWEYERAFRVYGITVAQVLLTRDDLEHRRRYLNSRNTLEALLEMQVVPIVNENDTVATEEIRFGDNDRLSALVAGAVDADLNLILSDIDGFYTANPQLVPDAQLLEQVGQIDDQVLAMAGASTSSVGTGGMLTKLQAAQLCQSSGIQTIVASGRGRHPLGRLWRSESGGTLFRSTLDRISARKRWILQGLQARGAVLVDAGAARALRAGASLLPIGVREVRGEFERGDSVEILGPDGICLARGLCAYGSPELRRIMGQNSAEIERHLGYVFQDEIVHRNNLVLVSKGDEQ